jgi:prepilin-type N-terminal cleavage/methylation domain-containing protein
MPASRTRNPRRRPPLGFSVLEVTVAIAILSIVSFFALDFMRSIINLDSQTRGILLAQEDMRRVFRRLVNDARLANSADNGAYPIARADSDTFIFYADADADGQAERIRYFLDGDALMRGVIQPAGVPPIYDPGSEAVTTVATDLVMAGQPVFEYYDSSYDGTSPPLAQPVTVFRIRLVKVTVIIDKNAIRAPDDQVFSTQISLRNLKDNL